MMPTPEDAENTPPGADATEGDATETETPVEGAETPVEGEPAAAAAEGEAPAEGEAKPDGEDKPKPDAAAVKLADKKVSELSEDELRKLGVQHANRTMAAARRAEKTAKDVATENARLKAQLADSGKTPSLRDDPGGALKAAGFNSIREWVDHVINVGADKQPSVDDKVAALEKQIREERDARARAENEAKVEASKVAVAKHIGANRERWPLTGSRLGQRILWEAIESYNDEHGLGGRVPDEAVLALADQVESDLRADGFSPPAAVKPATAKGQPAPSARPNAGKTLTGKGSSGPPVVRGHDPDESDDARIARIQREMREAGELT